MPEKKPADLPIPDKIVAYTKVELLAARARRQLLKAAAAIRNEKESP